MDAYNATNLRSVNWFDRLKGLVPRSIADRHVAIVGCGSVGSFMSDELARAGLMHFTLVDPDNVEWQNLTRTVFCADQVGMTKVDALRSHLLRIFPDLSIRGYAKEVQALRQHLPELFRGCDLVIIAVDDPKAIGVLDRYCYASGLVCLFVGIYRGAKGGEIIVVDPAITPCYGCATGGIRESITEVTQNTRVQRTLNYGTNRLLAEVALGSDIHFVASAAVKLGVSLLCRKDETAPLGQFIQNQLKEGVHYIMLAMESDYYIFPTTHSQALGQYAFQSLWLKTTRRSDCSRCGDNEYRLPAS